MLDKLIWEPIEKKDDTLGLPSPSGMGRAKVPGGWLVWAFGARSDTHIFLPDPDHEWK